MKTQQRKNILASLKQDIRTAQEGEEPEEVLCDNCRSLARNLRNGAEIALQISEILKQFIPALPEKMHDDKGYDVYDKNMAQEDLEEAIRHLKLATRYFGQVHDDFYLFQIDDNDEDYEEDEEQESADDDDGE
ncbi:MAG TPA: hypothetical protein DCR21_05055 [Succinivibrionaceae bacterium]|nr:hypothetical protein [Succinivibrionaceae bacterium]